MVKRGLCWRRRTRWGSGNLILESCDKKREVVGVVVVVEGS